MDYFLRDVLDHASLENPVLIDDAAAGISVRDTYATDNFCPVGLRCHDMEDMGWIWGTDPFSGVMVLGKATFREFLPLDVVFKDAAERELDAQERERKEMDFKRDFTRKKGDGCTKYPLLDY